MLFLDRTTDNGAFLPNVYIHLSQRYDQLAAVYENEQAYIKAKLTELEERIDKSRLRGMRE